MPTGTDRLLEQLKQKYKPVFQTIEAEQARIVSTHIFEDKLVLEAYVSSGEAKNRIWDRIKAINPDWDRDLIPDIRETGADVFAPAKPHERAQASGLKNIDTRNDPVLSAHPDALSNALYAAFRSEATPGFAAMCAELFSHSNAEERADVLGVLISGSDLGKTAELLPAFGLSEGRRVTPAEAERISPENVSQLAAQAGRDDDSVIERVSGFYSQHPWIVKKLDAAAQDAIARFLKAHPRGSDSRGGSH